MSTVLTNLSAETPEHEGFKAFAGLVTLKRELEDQLNEVEARIKALEPQLLAYLGEAGYEAVRVAGYTLSPHRDPWVYPQLGQSRQAVCNVLKACGLAHFVSEQYSTKSLTKYVRDLEVEHSVLGDEVLEFLPEGLARVIQVRPTYRIQARRR